MKPGYKHYDEMQGKEPQVGDRVFMKYLNLSGEIVGINDDGPVTMYQVVLENHTVSQCNKGSFVLVP